MDRTEYANALRQLANYISSASRHQQHLAKLTAQRNEAGKFFAMVPGAKSRAVSRTAPLDAQLQVTRNKVAQAATKRDQFYAQCGGNDFYPQAYTNFETLYKVAGLIESHRADSAGQAINMLTSQHASANAARRADQRHRQNLQQRQTLANRAILNDLWRDM